MNAVPHRSNVSWGLVNPISGHSGHFPFSVRICAGHAPSACSPPASGRVKAVQRPFPPFSPADSRPL